jgi:hypothetical protein
MGADAKNNINRDRNNHRSHSQPWHGLFRHEFIKAVTVGDIRGLLPANPLGNGTVVEPFPRMEVMEPYRGIRQILRSNRSHSLPFDRFRRLLDYLTVPSRLGSLEARGYFSGVDGSTL